MSNHEFIIISCVSFYRHIDSIRSACAATKKNAASLFETNESPWLLLESAHSLFSLAKSRVYDRVTGFMTDQMPPHVKPSLEEQPKWKLLVKLMLDISKKASNTGTFL